MLCSIRCRHLFIVLPLTTCRAPRHGKDELNETGEVHARLHLKPELTTSQTNKIMTRRGCDYTLPEPEYKYVHHYYLVNCLLQPARSQLRVHDTNVRKERRAGY
ncbi:hypothetical protein BD414DRAFT_63536 [Trametes punicea]|nr:hypothetical protein BD414DRAFT_63536 [Trametes punicea]